MMPSFPSGSTHASTVSAVFAIGIASAAIHQRVVAEAREGEERVAAEALGEHEAPVRPEQHFTQPPPRYTEASLVKSLESHGIGRPSTYASIIETLRYRRYVEMSGRAFVPTDIGKIVSKFLVKYLGTYVDYGFDHLVFHFPTNEQESAVERYGREILPRHRPGSSPPQRRRRSIPRGLDFPGSPLLPC